MEALRSLVTGDRIVTQDGTSILVLHSPNTEESIIITSMGPDGYQEFYDVVRGTSDLRLEARADTRQQYSLAHATIVRPD